MDVILKGLTLFETYYGMIWFIVLFFEMWYLMEKEKRNDGNNDTCVDVVLDGTESNEP